MKPASVVIMDEQPIVRMSIEVLLRKNSDIRVVLKSGSGIEVIDYIRKTKPIWSLQISNCPAPIAFPC